MIFSGDLTYMQAGIDTSGKPQAVSEFPSLKDLFFSIVPSNIVDPFKGGNILQVMFLAIFFGVVLNKMGLPKKAGQAISVVICVDPIAAMFNGVCNESANITTTFALAKSNNMLDKEVYYKSCDSTWMNESFCQTFLFLYSCG